MKKSKLTRFLALALAVVCTLTVVLAADWDLNKDGKVTVWDLQLADDTQKKDVLTAVLGGANELSPNKDGVYEIYSSVGLKNMANHAGDGASFKLMNDIDLMGGDWTPVAGFNGHFDGNNKTISNFTITKNSGINMGFFADTANDVVIENLNLANVDITITKDAQYVGAVVGTNRGDVNDCTAISVVTDPYKNLTKTRYIGALAGRNANLNGTQIGFVTNTKNFLTADSNCATYTDKQTVSAMMAMRFETLEDGSQKRDFGLIGYSNKHPDALWQDISNNSDLVDPVVRARREEVTRYMYEMCTVEWTVSEDMTYYRYENGGRKTESTYKPKDSAGVIKQTIVYRGLPYNHGAAGLERFEDYMTMGSDGRYTNGSDLPNEAYYYSDSSSIKAVNAAYDQYYAEGTSEETKAELLKTWPELPLMEGHVGSSYNVGFNQYIGNDCSSAVTAAWRRVSSSVVSEGGSNTLWTSYMFPSAYLQNKYGIRPVNGLSFTKEDMLVTIDGEQVQVKEDHSPSSKQHAAVIKQFLKNNEAYYFDTLACTSMGDVLMGYTNAGGHSLMAAGDAVVIRNSQGDILNNKSYIITHEQGGSFGTRSGNIDLLTKWKSSCGVNVFRTFEQLSQTGEYEGNSNIYVPISMDALHEKDTAAATARCAMTGGKVSSNFSIISTTVGGQTVYTKIEQSNNRRYACLELDVKTAHPNVQTGDAVQVLLSNGQVYNFTY